MVVATAPASVVRRKAPWAHLSPPSGHCLSLWGCHRQDPLGTEWGSEQVTADFLPLEWDWGWS